MTEFVRSSNTGPIVLDRLPMFVWRPLMKVTNKLLFVFPQSRALLRLWHSL